MINKIDLILRTIRILQISPNIPVTTMMPISHNNDLYQFYYIILKS